MPYHIIACQRRALLSCGQHVPCQALAPYHRGATLKGGWVPACPLQAMANDSGVLSLFDASQAAVRLDGHSPAAASLGSMRLASAAKADTGVQTLVVWQPNGAGVVLASSTGVCAGCGVVWW